MTTPLFWGARIYYDPGPAQCFAEVPGVGPVALGGGGGGVGNIQSFTAGTGISFFVIPAGVNFIMVTASAGGGGGGGENAGPSGGSGGAAGSCTVDQTLPVVPGETLTFTVGAGGAGGPANTGGSPGVGTTIVGSVSGPLLSLTGGAAGGSAPGGTTGGLGDFLTSQSGAIGLPPSGFGYGWGKGGDNIAGGIGGQWQGFVGPPGGGLRGGGGAGGAVGGSGSGTGGDGYVTVKWIA